MKKRPILSCRYYLLAALMGSMAWPIQAQPPKVQTDTPGYSTKQAAREEFGLQPDLENQLAGIRRLYSQFSAYVEPVNPLPDDVSMPERGEELPLEIARSVNPRLLAKLPQYTGYEWREGGEDLVLVESAEGSVEAILEGVVGEEGQEDPETP